MSDYIVWFDGYDDLAHRCRVGGKNASLGAMMAARLPVPPGFAVTTDAYDRLRAQRDLGDEVEGLLGDVDLADPVGLRQVSDKIRQQIEAESIEPRIERAIREAYETLADRCEIDDVPVAVRSSATAEDLPDASFAGQQDTFLWVTGSNAVVERVKSCWSSLFTGRAMAYRHEMGYDERSISMSVGVQKMVHPKTAGVAFTLNPRNGDRSQVAIDASWGFGEAVVSGEVTPDNFLVDKVIHEIVARTIAPKTIEYRLGDAHAVEKADVEPERQTVPCLTDDEIRAVATMAQKAERHYGRPQDVEWAIDRHGVSGENAVLLQTRPETVWSRKAVAPIGRPGVEPVQSIVDTLLSPLHARGGAGRHQTNH